MYFSRKQFRIDLNIQSMCSYESKHKHEHEGKHVQFNTNTNVNTYTTRNANKHKHDCAGVTADANTVGTVI